MVTLLDALKGYQFPPYFWWMWWKCISCRCIHSSHSCFLFCRYAWVWVFLLFLQHVPIYFLTYRECGEVRMLPTRLLFLVRLSAKPRTCRDNDAVMMSAAEMVCSACSCLLGLHLVVLRLFPGFCATGTFWVSHVFYELRVQCECLMVCVKSPQNVCF